MRRLGSRHIGNCAIMITGAETTGTHNRPIDSIPALDVGILTYAYSMTNTQTLDTARLQLFAPILI